MIYIQNYLIINLLQKSQINELKLCNTQTLKNVDISLNKAVKKSSNYQILLFYFQKNIQESNTLSSLMDLIHFGQDSNPLALGALS